MRTRIGAPAALGVVVCALLLPPATKRAYAAAPAERLMSAIATSSLDTPGLKPWHLKMDVTVYDETGKNPVTGIIERWQTDDANKTIYTFGNASATSLSTETKSYRMHSGPFIPALADSVLDETLHPGPREGDLKGVEPDLRREAFGTIKLDCIMLVRPTHFFGTVPLGLYPTYCLTPDQDRLRVSYNFGSFTVLRNDIGMFQSRDVATHLTLKEQQITLADARITTLETFAPVPGQFAPDSSMQQSGGVARLAGGVMAGHLVSKVTPIYPASARQAHISGTVLLEAIISRDGHVRSLRPVSSADPDLTIAAIDAVRRWTYQPYMLNGEPAEVDTTITVNFNLNPR